MVKTNKKAYLHTLEAAIAAVLTFAVIFVLMPRIYPVQEVPKQEVLASLQYNENFRECAIERNFSCVNQTIFENLPQMYKQKYVVNLTNDANYIPALPNDKEVKTESIYIAGSMTDYDPIIVKLFYWA